MNHKKSESTSWCEAMQESKRAEHARRERDRSNGLCLSFDDERYRDYVEIRRAKVNDSPELIAIREQSKETLYAMLDRLTETQQRRIYLRFWERMGYCAIASGEGVDESAVRRCIERALGRLKKLLCGACVSQEDFAKPPTTVYIKHRRKKKPQLDTQEKPLPS